MTFLFKWPGVRGSTVSPSQGRGASGRLFKPRFGWVLSQILQRWVWSLRSLASNVTSSLWLRIPTIPWSEGCILGWISKWCFAWHRILRRHLESWLWKKVMNSLTSFTAPTKLVPWSLHNNEGLPLRAMNHHKAAIKASVERSEANSRYTTLTGTHTYALTNDGLRIDPYLSVKGPQ